MVRGEAWEAIGTHKAADGSTPENITNWTIKLTARKQPGTEGDPVFQVLAEVTDGPGGEYVFTASSSQTLAVRSTINYATGDDTPYVADIWRIDTGFEARMATGTLTVEKGVYFQ